MRLVPRFLLKFTFVTLPLFVGLVYFYGQSIEYIESMFSISISPLAGVISLGLVLLLVFHLSLSKEFATEI